MKKLIFTLCCLLLIFNVFANDATHSFSLTTDFAFYPDNTPIQLVTRLFLLLKFINFLPNVIYPNFIMWKTSVLFLVWIMANVFSCKIGRSSVRFCAKKSKCLDRNLKNDVEL